MPSSLKFKGDQPKKKKTKSSTSSSSAPAIKASSSSSTTAQKRSEEQQGQDDFVAAFDNLPDSGKTEAEKRFEREQLKRLAKKAEKEAHRSHKDRVQEFNDKLESLSEHHDIPKVGPG